MSEQPILYEKLNGIGKIWLNCPQNGNRITRKLFLALDAAVSQAIADPEIRVIIITAKGEHFCCGFDVGDPEASLNNNESGSISWEARRANTQEEVDLWMKMTLCQQLADIHRGRTGKEGDDGTIPATFIEFTETGAGKANH